MCRNQTGTMRLGERSRAHIAAQVRVRDVTTTKPHRLPVPWQTAICLVGCELWRAHARRARWSWPSRRATCVPSSTRVRRCGRFWARSTCCRRTRRICWPPLTRRAASKAVGAPASQPLVEPLTGRELDVLRLIARGQTNQKIADEFFISVNTVKTHAKHIYDRIFYSSVVVHLVERLWIYEGERDISQGFSEMLRGRRRRERDFVCGGKGRDLRAAGAQRRGQDQHAGMPGGSLNSEK